MYTNILMPTDESELARKAVQHGHRLGQTDRRPNHRTDGLAAFSYLHYRREND
jgi:hypothetical protein